MTPPHGLSLGLVWGLELSPHLNSLFFLRALCPPRLRAAGVQQAVAGGRRQGCRRRRVALAGEPPRAGPGPPVRGFSHLSQLDGVRSSLLRRRPRIQVSHWGAQQGAPRRPSSVCLGLESLCVCESPKVARHWGRARAGGLQTPQDGLLTMMMKIGGSQRLPLSQAPSKCLPNSRLGRSAYARILQKRRFRDLRR